MSKEQDKLNELYDKVKKMQYALSYDSKFDSLLTVSLDSSPDVALVFQLTREEILTILDTRRSMINEQLNSPKNSGESFTKH